MVRHFYFPAFVLLMMLFPVRAQSEIFQRFDQEGNLIQSGRIKSDYFKPKVKRYLIPAGILLYKDVNYESYPVFGKTLSEIINSSEENGPFNKNENRRFPSKFEWSPILSYQYTFSSAIDEDDKTVHVVLEIYDIEIDCDITITLPALIDNIKLNSVEINLWKNYLQRLVDHEHDHVKFIKETYANNAFLKNLKDINYFTFDYINNLDIEKTIEFFLRKETKKIGREWINKIKIRNDKYDIETEHGKKHEKRKSFFKKQND